MTEKIISKENFDQIMQKLQEEEFDLYAPTRKEDGTMVWSSVDKAEDLLWEFQNTEVSPKNFIFPQTECMMHFKNKKDDPQGLIMEEEPPLQKHRALINIRPCDAKAFEVLDRVYCQDEKSTDPYWKDKRDKTLMIGLACNSPCPTCFCTSVNTGPYHEEGLDILLQDIGDRLVLKPLTEKGESMVQDLPEANSDDLNEAEKRKQKAEDSIVSFVGMDKVNARDVIELYELPHWDRVHETCINCGTCTWVCPTCHCFDIQDEVQGEYGRRIRDWDTCMSWLFTYHTSGHNPRGTKKDRVRQRFMHKFKYMPIKFEGAIGCVGCGRCTRKCPVDIDVRETVNNMNK